MSYTLRYWLVVIAFIVAQVLSLTLSIVFGLFSNMSLETAMSMAVVIPFFLGAVTMMLLIRNAHPLMRPEKPRSNIGPTIGWIFAGVALALIGQNLGFAIQSGLYGAPRESENTMMLLEVMSSVPIMLLAVVIFGPIMEEILFRQVIFGKLYKHMNFFFAAGLSSLAFSIVHMEIANIFVYAGAGFAFAFVYVMSNRIIVPIIAHCLMNAVASLPILLEYLGYDVLEMMENVEQMTQFITPLIGVFFS
ncbi:lysostaphin resistance A-like protein [Geomicrobium sp. JSM 1781026]